MAGDLIKCPQCNRPMVLYKWMGLDSMTEKNKETFQGPSTHPHIENWCTGNCYEDIMGGGWDYRLILYPKTGDLPQEMGIHEVFYSKDGMPTVCTVHPVGAIAASPDDIMDVLEQMKAAILKPPLSYEKDFPNLPAGDNNLRESE